VNLERYMKIEGFTDEPELEWLHNRAQGMDGVLEVGCWKGRTAAVLADASRHAFTVDTFLGSASELDAAHAEALTTDLYEQAARNLFGYPVRILRMSSLVASRLFAERSLDMVFIDGEHTRESVLIDLIAWKPKVRKLICGHDVNWQGVAEALAIFGMPFELGPGSLWYTEIID
jgi:hypothetical protein